MNKLKGHTLNKVVLNEDKTELILTLDDDKCYILKVHSECCSEGGFVAVTQEWLGLPQKIVNVEETKEIDKKYTDELRQIYTKTLTLENGKKVNIVYDNISNGYYGSSLDGYYK